MTLVSNLIALGEQLAAERDAAFDLWTWLPSYAVAQRHHGDYAGEHRPSNRDVMREAAEYFARLKRPDAPLTLEESRRAYECPCGEDHEP